MELRLPPSKNISDFAAGVVGLVFDRLERVVPPPAADDLTLINGIGPAYALRLKEAGITTFAQLAALTPDQLRQIARLKVWQGEPGEWIAQAKARL
jgi:predicted flap endonuclease-1-like 5' DNA nuclease